MSAEQDCESATHKCGQCGKEHNFGEFAASRSPCLLGCLLSIAGRTTICARRPA
jgi:hypothetical protein